ncbi:MAG: glycosyltransferase family 4 protein [Patescibacteria group bacterium]|nr:glycosyltransferase family 4 protein [Patescibacteria group bacterium]MDE2589647.1 glycosyltransferase family 4 protein [Patescibacteria group bacterium]
MKIGILGTIWLDIPPHDYGGTEQVIYNLVNGLSSRGHDVTLFGPQTAKIKGNLFPTVKFPLRELNIPWTDILYHLYHISEAFDHIREFDILHVHLNRIQDYITLPLASLSPVPVLFTFHGLLPTKRDKPDEYHMLTKYRYLPFTSISDSQRANLPLNFIDTVYNSVNIKDYPFCKKSDDYLVWLGKVNPRKGTKEAIEIAQKANMPIHLMGKVDKDEPSTWTYYKNEVKPLLELPNVTWEENVPLEKKAKILGNAKAFINPLQWNEPFGLVMIEAQSTGTPVIVLNRGSAAEVVENGTTGFVVETLDEMVAKIAEIDTINRTTCRRFVTDKFSIQHMIIGYEHAYQKTIQSWYSAVQIERKSLEKR